MSRRDWIISLVSGVLLSLLAVANALQDPGFVVAARAQADAEIEGILTEMLASHTLWSSLEGRAETTWFGPSGETQRYVEDIAIALPASVWVELLQEGAAADARLWMTDGNQVFDISPEMEIYSASHFPAFAQDTSRLPKSPGEASADVICPYPLALLIPSAVAEYVFPHWFAQGDGAYELIGEEDVLGRPAWLISYQTDTDSVRASVDQQSGIILRYDQETNGLPVVHFEFLTLNLDESVDETRFEAPDGYELRSSDN